MLSQDSCSWCLCGALVSSTGDEGAGTNLSLTNNSLSSEWDGSLTTDSRSNNNNSTTSNTENYGGNGSDDNRSDLPDPSLRHPSVEPWIAPPPDGVEESFALVTVDVAGDTYTTKPSSAGCVGALVSVRHLLVDGSCAQEMLLGLSSLAPKATTSTARTNTTSSSPPMVALLSTRSFEVDRLMPIGPNNSLVLVALVEEVEAAVARPFAMPTNQATPNEMLSNLQVVSFDDVLRGKNNQRLVASSAWIPCARHVCRVYDPSVASCFAFGQVEHRQRYGLVQAGFLITSQDHVLVGVVSKASREQVQPSNGLIPFVRMDKHVRDALDRATDFALFWKYSGDLRPNGLLSLSRFQYLTQLMFAMPKPWTDSCQAVLIAPTFVLTSSDCFDERNPVTSVVVGIGSRGNGGLETIPVKATKVEGAAMLLELGFVCSFSPVSLVSTFAQDTGDADPVLVHVDMNGTTGLKVTTERMHLIANESICGAARQVPGKTTNDPTSTVGCVQSVASFQGLEPAISMVPRRGDPVAYQRKRFSLMFGFATAVVPVDSSAVLFHRVDLLGAFLSKYARGYRWHRMVDILGTEPDLNEEQEDYVIRVANFIDAHVGVDHRWRFPRKKSDGGEVQCRSCNHDDGVGGAPDNSPPSVSSSSGVASTRPIVPLPVAPQTTSSYAPNFKSSETTNESSKTSGNAQSSAAAGCTRSYTLAPGLPASVHRGVTSFVFGEQKDSWVRLFPKGMWEALHNNDKRLVFLSSKNLSGLQQVIQRFVDRAAESGRASRRQCFGELDRERAHASNVCTLDV